MEGRVGLSPCNPIVLAGSEVTVLMAEAEFSVTPKRCKIMAARTETPG